MTGTDIQDGLIDCARTLGYLVFHARESRKSEPGFPDLVIVGFGRVYAVECKSRNEGLRPSTTTRKGRNLPGQLDWLKAFGDGAPQVEAFVCRDGLGGSAYHIAPGSPVVECGYDFLIWQLKETAGR